MSHSKSYEFLLKNISTLKGVGPKTKKLLEKLCKQSKLSKPMQLEKIVEEYRAQQKAA